MTTCCPGTLDRRDFLRAGFLGLGGLTLSDFLRLRAQASGSGNTPQTSCILVWLGGGPSHLDTYDLKPEAPAEFRGKYRPIRSREPGLHLCELLPRHANLAHRFTLIRSCHHHFTGHWDGSQHVLTGRPAVLTNGGTATSVHPEVGAVVKRMRPAAGTLPNYVAVSHPLGAVGPAYLGPGYEPFVVRGNPNDRDFRVANLDLPTDAAQRLEDRRRLQRSFDNLRRDLDRFGSMDAMDQFDREAVRLLTGRQAQLAFDLTLEDTRTRDRYGRCLAGQSLLLARRLVEAGVCFVSAEVSTFREAGVDGGWDDHASFCNIYTERMDRRLPVFDRALTALIEDIYERGLNERVLVVAMGEFGRTPRINYVDGRPGREHYPFAMSVLISGGRMRVGQVIGETDSRGERPRARPITPMDVLATIYRFLDIDVRHEFRDHSGRPLPILPDGEPIRELL